MARPANFFRTLDGVPVRYDRTAQAPYGSHGIQYDFHATEELEGVLDRCFAEIWEKCPLGKGNIIISAGAWVDKPGKHGTGEAFDLDGIHWDEKSFICLDYPSDPSFYLGIEAILRKHLPTVLDYNYNTDHHDHLHIDLGGSIGFRTNSQARVFFLQAALTHVLNIPVGIDGDWGTETSGATEVALERLGISGALTERPVWLQFLDRVAELAFGTAPIVEEKTPTELLRDVYTAISEELAEGSATRERIENALKTFAAHPRIDPLLLDEVNTNGAKEVVVSSQTVDGKVKWSAVVDGGAAFYVGTQTTYEGKKGLFNYEGDKYDPANYHDAYGFWADFVFPTASVESLGGRFNCLNTYDGALFTIGFMQFAAHVFDGDFARYFRGLLALPEAAAYFPDLTLKDGFIHQKTDGGTVMLEMQGSDVDNISPLMKYLNPTSSAIERREVENAARFIHWTKNSAEARDAQVRVGVETFKRILRTHADAFDLDGRMDKVCLVIADIYHHGRGKPNREQKIRTALDTNGDAEAAYENLLKIGSPRWDEPRLNPLRAVIRTMVQQGKLAKMKYNKAANDFVPL